MLLLTDAPATASLAPDLPALTHETAFWAAGLPLVAGVDEVGRGALAGPLVAAAVVLPAVGGAALASLRAGLAAVRDSKLLRPEEREALVAPVTALAVAVGVGAVPPAELDGIGLAAANRLAMERAVAGLGLLPDALLLDACVIDLGLPQVGLIDGDARCLSIAAASIIAKVHRDRPMAALDAEDDRYCFARHKGYGSVLHLERLRAHGPGPHHRYCFAPVAACAAACSPVATGGRAGLDGEMANSALAAPASPLTSPSARRRGRSTRATVAANGAAVDAPAPAATADAALPSSPAPAPRRSSRRQGDAPRPATAPATSAARPGATALIATVTVSGSASLAAPAGGAASARDAAAPAAPAAGPSESS